jgi:signal transduction histidine kinase
VVPLSHPATALRRVNAAGMHLLGLIKEVLELSRIEAGKLELNFEWLNLSLLIEEVIGTAEQLAEKSNNRIVLGTRPAAGRNSSRRQQSGATRCVGSSRASMAARMIAASTSGAIASA